MRNGQGVQSRPSRLLRVKDAASYCAMSRASFLRKVSEGVFPKAIRISNGIVAWDVSDLDAAIDEIKDNAKASAGNTMHQILGIRHDDDDA